MSAGADCLFEYSIDRLYEALNEADRCRGAVAMALEVFDVCGNCPNQDCPGMGRMMTDRLDEPPQYTKIGPVAAFPSDRSPFLVTRVDELVHSRTGELGERVVANVAK